MRPQPRRGINRRMSGRGVDENSVHGETPFVPASVLDRATSLLEEVKGAISDSNKFSVPRDLPPVPVRAEYLTFDSEVQLLLDGIPEMQLGDDIVSDDLVDHLLKLGGKPPSQLQLPTVQLNQFEVMNQLPNVKKLRVAIRNLSVFSARYGVRKEGSFIKIKCPHYYEATIGDNPFQSGPLLDLTVDIMLEKTHKPVVTPFIKRGGVEKSFHLKELELLEDPKTPIQRKNDKKDSIKKFFIGDCDLMHVLLVDILVTDRLLQDWMRGENLIELQLCGYIAPPGTLQRGILASPTCFARAKINPISLLNCPGMDAMVNADLIAAKETLADVTSRMILILAGQPKRALSERMGVISARLTLLELENDEVTTRKLMEQPTSTIPSQVKGMDQVPSHPVLDRAEERALHFEPKEAPKQSVPSPPSSGPRIAASQPPSMKREVFLGIALFEITGDVVAKIFNVVRSYPHSARQQLTFRYKVSKERTDVMTLSLDQCQLHGSRQLLLPIGKICQLQASLTRPPCLELWFEVLDDRELPVRELLAWTSVLSTAFHRLETISLTHPASLQPCGQLRAVFHQNASPYKVEEALQLQLDAFRPSEVSDDTQRPIWEEKKDAERYLTQSIVRPLSDPVELKTSIVINKSTNSDKDDVQEDRSRSVSVCSEDSLVVEQQLSQISMSGKGAVQSDISSDDLPAALVPSVSEVVAQSDASSTLSNSSGFMPFLLDIVPHGNSSVFSHHTDDHNSSRIPPTMGCFVCYTLPALLEKEQEEEQQRHVKHPSSIVMTMDHTAGTRVIHFTKAVIHEEKAMFTLWWDADCPILNGRNRHRFSLPVSSVMMNGVDTVDLDSLARQLGVDKHRGIEFFVVGSDVDGNLLQHESYVSRGTLSLETLAKCLGNSQIPEHILTIPLQDNPAYHSNTQRTNGSSPPHQHLHAAPRELVLSLSWRMEPRPIDTQTQQLAVSRPTWQPLATDDTLNPKLLEQYQQTQQTAPLLLLPPIDRRVLYRDFTLYTYAVRVLAFAHLHVDYTKPGDLLYSVVWSAANQLQTPPAAVLEKVAYHQEDFSVVSSTFPKLPGHLHIDAEHQLLAPVRKPLSSNTTSVHVNNPTSIHQAQPEQEQIHRLSDLGAITLSLYERITLFGTNPSRTLRAIGRGDDDLPAHLPFDHISYSPSPSKSQSKQQQHQQMLVQATDKLLGTAVVDLGVLLRGMSMIEGWYNLVDPVQKVVGQVLLQVVSIETERDFPDDDSPDHDNDGGFSGEAKTSASVVSPPGNLSHPSQHGEQYRSSPARKSVDLTERHSWDSLIMPESVQHIQTHRGSTHASVEAKDDVYEEEPLLDLTSMEHASLQQLLADLDRTKEDLLTYGLNYDKEAVRRAHRAEHKDGGTGRDALSESVESSSDSSNVHVPEETPGDGGMTPSTSQYSSDFESFMSEAIAAHDPPPLRPYHNAERRRSSASAAALVMEEKPIDRDDDAEYGFTATLEEQASPVKQSTVYRQADVSAGNAEDDESTWDASREPSPYASGRGGYRHEDALDDVRGQCPGDDEVNIDDDEIDRVEPNDSHAKDEASFFGHEWSHGADDKDSNNSYSSSKYAYKYADDDHYDDERYGTNREDSKVKESYEENNDGEMIYRYDDGVDGYDPSHFGSERKDERDDSVEVTEGRDYVEGKQSQNDDNDDMLSHKQSLLVADRTFDDENYVEHRPPHQVQHHQQPRRSSENEEDSDAGEADRQEDWRDNELREDRSEDSAYYSQSNVVDDLPEAFEDDERSKVPVVLERDSAVRSVDVPSSKRTVDETDDVDLRSDDFDTRLNDAADLSTPRFVLSRQQPPVDDDALGAVDDETQTTPHPLHTVAAQTETTDADQDPEIALLQRLVQAKRGEDALQKLLSYDAPALSSQAAIFNTNPNHSIGDSHLMKVPSSSTGQDHSRSSAPAVAVKQSSPRSLLPAKVQQALLAAESRHQRQQYPSPKNPAPSSIAHNPNHPQHLLQQPHPHAGRQRRFVDAETERVSRIMMGVLSTSKPI